MRLTKVHISLWSPGRFMGPLSELLCKSANVHNAHLIQNNCKGKLHFREYFTFFNSISKVWIQCHPVNGTAFTLLVRIIYSLSSCTVSFYWVSHLGCRNVTSKSRNVLTVTYN